VRTPQAADASAEDGPGAPVDAAIDAMPDAPPSNLFVDMFSRADAADIGNGWIEKVPATFSLAGGEVVRIQTTTSYRDNMVYRPTSEDVRDVEVSIRVRFVQTPPRFPQIFVRARSATINAVDSYDGYLLYVSGSSASNQAVLGRQLGNVFVSTLATITLSPALDTTSSFRMTLRATGTNPVALSATIERLEGTSWVTIGATSVNDTAAERIQTAGTVGFAGDEVAAYVYDEFRRTAL
jgi:hypothetical protein